MSSYLVTNGSGVRLEFDTLEEALAAWPNEMWHVYELQHGRYVQIR
jgi:hypothetical protein